MCGIVGGVARRPFPWLGRGPGHEGDPLERALDALTYRGPDGRERWVSDDGRAVLGHTRLSIVDLDGGDQPLVDESGRLRLVFNGEIYNHLELRDELLARGHAPRTRSDGEAALHLFEERPEPACADALDGMFALALYDERGDAPTLTLVRDRNGIKPLYVYEDEDQLLFASELGALLALLGRTPAVDGDALRAYLRWKYVPAPRSIFAGVRKLRPGHATVARLAGDRLEARTEAWWQPRLQDPPLADEAEALEQLDAALRRAVTTHLRADVPVGALLSGGVDSSLVVALACELGQPLQTFTVGWREKGFDPLAEARLLAERWGCEHHETYLELPDPLAELPDLARHFGEPFGDSSAIACFQVSRFARQHVKVALTGDGGDESFAGYKHSESALGDDGPTELLRPLRAAAHTGLAALFSPEAKFVRPMRERTVARSRRHLVRRELTTPWLRRLLLGEAHRLSQDEADARDPFATDFARFRDAHGASRAARLIDLTQLMPGDMLAKVDRTSMSCGLECRVPLLDHHVTEVACRLTPELLVAHGQRKYLLKKLAERYVPHELLYRKKKGFRIPIKRWLKRDLLAPAADQLRGGAAVAHGLLDAAGVERALRLHRRRSVNLSSTLWTLLCLEHWARIHLG